LSALRPEFEETIRESPSEFSPPHSFVVVDERPPLTVSFPRRLLLYARSEAEESITRTEVILEPQDEGGFVAFSTEHRGAVGQGETIEAAVDDLEQAIELLQEVLDEE
jgi:predicted RNase H-like HicB family nuclease